MLTLDYGKDDVVVDEFLAELADFLFFFEDLGLLRAFLLGKVLHVVVAFGQVTENNYSNY